MEYEDDEYDQYQQYEDELYKDASEESESNDEVDSELEDNMLARIHYSTNVYKRVGSNASKSSEGQTANGSANNTNLTDNHLAAPPTAAEDYFNAVNQEYEQDSDNDDGNVNASTHVNNQDVTNFTTTDMNGNNQKNIDPDEEHGESRYSVEKKGASKNDWNQHAIAAGNSPNKETNGDENGSDESDTSDEEGAISGEEAADRVSFAEEEIELDQHVIDLGASLDDTQEEANDYDLNAELGHLDDEGFKGHTRYYLESKPKSELFAILVELRMIMFLVTAQSLFVIIAKRKVTYPTTVLIQEDMAHTNGARGAIRGNTSQMIAIDKGLHIPTSVPVQRSALNLVLGSYSKDLPLLKRTTTTNQLPNQPPVPHPIATHRLQDTIQGQIGMITTTAHLPPDAIAITMMTITEGLDRNHIQGTDIDVAIIETIAAITTTTMQEKRNRGGSGLTGIWIISEILDLGTVRTMNAMFKSS
ncbi:hypothetical protein BGZ80_000693 [Entomortierella chlamydospora]|uniref:Uncharacterized protein n=1 Tax=Entomortierella chlamydospora TaxID=101097 RepID=A0A9P6N2A4_9FUNG|nr:hypothetical protein BGZ80_000693 [Entomortierella chlamydospora]